MYLSDLTALDRLIDFYGENLKVRFESVIYDLEELRDLFNDTKKNCSIDNHFVKINGIYDVNNNLIIEIFNDSNFQKDDLIKF